MKLKEILTLFSFLCLISFFVMVHSGSCNQLKIGEGFSLQLSPNGGAVKPWRHVKREQFIELDTLYPDSLELESYRYRHKRRYLGANGKPYIVVRKDSLGRELLDSLEHSQDARLWSSKNMPIIERVVINDSLYYRWLR